MMKIGILVFNIVFAVGCVESRMSGSEKENIGEATMLEDRTIVLYLRAETGSAIGDAMLTFSPDDERYQQILQHVGPISIGDSKPVPPWDDNVPE